MSGMLTTAAKQEDYNADGQDEDLEELYVKLYGKIARDFVHQDDLREFLQLLLRMVDPAGVLTSSSLATVQAKKRGLAYKALYKSGKDSGVYFKDLIKMDDNE